MKTEPNYDDDLRDNNSLERKIKLIGCLVIIFFITGAIFILLAIILKS